MPPAARITDMTTHGSALTPGPGSPNVLIGFLPAWRAVPSSVAAALESLSNAMSTLMQSPVLNPATAASQIVQVVQGMMSLGAASAGAGQPGVLSAAASQAAAVGTQNASLTAAWTSASAVPGGQPAADVAYTQGIKAAMGAAATSVVGAMAGMADQHMCPLPCPVPVHGPGMVTRGSATVFINNLPACRLGDQVMEACGGADPIALACFTVMIG